MTTVELSLMRDLADRMRVVMPGCRLDAFLAALDWADGAGLLDDALLVAPDLTDDACGDAKRDKQVAAVRPSAAPKRQAAEWSRSDEETLIRLKRSGCGWAQIADQLGRSENACQFRWYDKLKKQASAEEARPGRNDEPPPSPVNAVKVEAPEAAPPAVATVPRPADSDARTQYHDGSVIWHKSMKPREIARHYDSLDHTGWSADRDQLLVQAVVRGEGISQAALAARVAKEEALRRWKQLLPLVSVDNQVALLVVLKERAGAADAA